MVTQAIYIRDRHNSCNFLVTIAILAITTFGDHNIKYLIFNNIKILITLIY